jgi:hypothetical protein
MDIDKTAAIFVGTILLGFTFITAAGAIVVINNLFARWWKPVKWTNMYVWSEHLQDPLDPNHQPTMVATPVNPTTPWPFKSHNKVDPKT